MSSVYLLDANVLIALADRNHIHHRQAHQWFAPTTLFATCPITQGALIRYFLRQVEPSMPHAKGALAAFTNLPSHHFWPDDLAFDDVPTRRIRGHRQVTDAYLATLARKHGGVLATLDEALAAIHPDVQLI